MLGCPIWTYWEGPCHPYIHLCLSTMQKVFGKRLNIVTPETLDQYLPPKLLHENWKRIPQIAPRVCCIRAALIYEHGGWWFDADTVALKQAPRQPLGGFNYTTWKRYQILNGYFGAREKNPTTKCWLSFINRVLEYRFEKQGNVWWLTLGEVLLTPSVVMYGGKHFPLRRCLPLNFSRDPEAFLRPGRIQQYVKKQTICFGLNNSWLMEHALDELNKTPEQQSRSPLLIHSILNRARQISGLT